MEKPQLQFMLLFSCAFGGPPSSGVRVQREKQMRLFHCPSSIIRVRKNTVLLPYVRLRERIETCTVSLLVLNHYIYDLHTGKLLSNIILNYKN